MFKRSLAILAVFVVAALTAAAPRAQPSGQPRSPTVMSIKDAIVKATGAESGTIELTAAAKIFTVKVVNGKFANGTSAGRENEAGVIESIVATAIAGKAEFMGIVVIVVEYVKRGSAGRPRIVDSIEFRKDATGAFRHHIT